MHPLQDCVRVYLLGRFEVKSGDRVIIDQHWPRRKAKALFKHLALNNGAWLHREQLLDALWPEVDPAAANHNFRQNLYYIRQAFEERGLVAPVVTADHSTVGLAPDTWVDVDAFRVACETALQPPTDPELYEQALELYQGDLLPEDMYEDWTQLQRDELRGLRRQLMLELASLHEAAGRGNAAVQYLEALTRLDPLDEEAHQALIRLYAASGDRLRAQRQYERCREALQRELGVEPSEETEAIYRGALEGRQSAPGRRDSVMGPQIHYAKTSDGVSIAYWTVGDGMPLVWSTGFPGTNLQREWQTWRVMFEWMARRWRVVRFDCRGSGLSQHQVSDLSLDGFVLDIEAIVDTLGLRKFAVWGTIFGGPIAIAYAARHPDKVSHLILGNSYVRGAEFSRLPRIRATLALRDADWNTYVDVLAHLYFPDPAAGASYLRSIGPPEAQRALQDAAAEIDVTELLPQVRCPTLVLQLTGAPYMPDVGLDAARELASRIPAASLFGTDGFQATFRAVEEFLAGEKAVESVSVLPQGTTAILFADIADSTALTEQMGDMAFRERARALDAALRGVIRENGGTPVEGKLLGDGVLAVFTSARQAIEGALACGRAGADAGLPLHLGLHAGDVIREEDNVYGGAVNIAARISALSSPGEVLVSGTVRSLARTSAGVAFEDLGERELKGVGEPVRMWAVRLPNDD